VYRRKRMEENLKEKPGIKCPLHLILPKSIFNLSYYQFSFY
jgi:hypothetical protein